MPSSRIPLMFGSTLTIVFGSALTVMGLVIGCVAARVTTFTCIRASVNQQGICQLEKSTVFLPWIKTVSRVPLSNVQKAKVRANGYTVVLQLRDNSPSFWVYESEYSENSQRVTEQINSFLSHAQTRSFSIQQGGGLEETIALIGFCGFSLSFAWLGVKTWQHTHRKMHQLKKCKRNPIIPPAITNAAELTLNFNSKTPLISAIAPVHLSTMPLCPSCTVTTAMSPSDAALTPSKKPLTQRD